MVALLNQNGKYTTGAGEINGTLYSLAATGALTPPIPRCDLGQQLLPGAGELHQPTSFGYAAATGYDEVTGLGSLDIGKLAATWPAASAARQD